MFIVEEEKVDYLLNNINQDTSIMWEYGNDILYSMCKNRPLHNDRNAVASKIWLIGRSYAASIERVKEKISSSEVYDCFLDEITNNALNFDNKLQKLTKVSCNEINKNLSLIFETHLMLTEAFKKATKLEKRSLASKYLHFHCPNIFFIYDSRARLKINYLVKSKGNKTDCIGDFEYVDFYLRMLELQKYLNEKTKKIYTPRELDNFLLFYEYK